jgi:ketosteroid isomerase-like protein
MQTPTQIVTAYYEAFNRRDHAVYSRLFTADCRLVAPGVEASGIETVKAFDHAWSSAFSEARIESLRMVECDGAVLAANWFHGGTHTQPLQTGAGVIPPAGRTFEAPYCARFEFDGDRIKTQQIAFDADYVPAALGVK